MTQVAAADLIVILPTQVVFGGDDRYGGGKEREREMKWDGGGGRFDDFYLPPLAPPFCRMSTYTHTKVLSHTNVGYLSSEIIAACPS